MARYQLIIIIIIIIIIVRNMSAEITYILDTANELMLLMSSVILTDVMLLQSLGY